MTGDQWYNVLLAVLPSVVVFLTAFLLMRQFLATRSRAEGSAAIQAIRQEDRKHTLPLRLQAYERLALFLERIAPGAMVFRIHKHNMTASMLHGELLATIREEFEHNVTQQVYVSDKAWQQVKMAKEETLRIINIAYEQTGKDPSATALVQRIFETASKLTQLPTQVAMGALKDEIRKLF